jgi:hypothetical protein
VESGALLTERYWTALFDHFAAENYEQRLLIAAGELLTQVVPNVELPTAEEINTALNITDLNITYRADEDEYAWPFIVTEKNGEQCLFAPNKELDDSYAIIYLDVELKAGQALGFDYLRSSETGGDMLHVIVNDEPIYSISGWNDPEKWETCYPVVADQDGVYEIALCYIKDSSDSEGDDTVYIDNLRLVDVKDIDVPTYIPRKAATTTDGFAYSYVEIVFNSKDGYYHVGSANGPLLLVDLMSATDFDEEQSIWEMAYAGKVKVDGVDYTEKLTDHPTYSVCIIKICKKVCNSYHFSSNLKHFSKLYHPPRVMSIKRLSFYAKHKFIGKGTYLPMQNCLTNKRFVMYNFITS